MCVCTHAHCIYYKDTLLALNISEVYPAYQSIYYRNHAHTYDSGHWIIPAMLVVSHFTRLLSECVHSMIHTKRDSLHFCYLGYSNQRKFTVRRKRRRRWRRLKWSWPRFFLRANANPPLHSHLSLAIFCPSVWKHFSCFAVRGEGVPLCLSDLWAAGRDPSHHHRSHAVMQWVLCSKTGR